MRLIALCLCLLIFAGCASTQHTAATQPCAKCLVCVKNADLACVDVVVDSDTPRFEYGGKTYYFCGEECRAMFAKDPATYAR